MCAYCNEHEELFRLFEFSLLITLSTANDQQGFFVLTLMLLKQRNLVSPNSSPNYSQVLPGPSPCLLH